MLTNRELKAKIAFTAIRASALIVVAVACLLILHIVVNGYKIVSWSFILDSPRRGMTAGGIFPAIYGTVCLIVLTLAFALPIGLASAIYFSEYFGSKWSSLVIITRAASNILAGVPSIVYGLLGLGLFVLLTGFGFSLLSSSLTLSFLTLPVIIAASEEALHSVPLAYREAALALGATRWQTVRHAVLPYAIPGMITASILALSRAAGETAPILLTGAAYFLPRLPTSIFDQFMALPFHIFTLSTQSVNPAITRPIQYGTVLVLISLVLGMNLVAIMIRAYYRKRVRALL
ncbi:phosphate ABC transporter permease PstA [Candidatus Bathyarchaeota archaeon]|nr:phosphate ABC transporter permease PstA [Candidatus Bathyarchaeota archaeon]